MASATDLPNPSTPLAFLPPDLADQWEVSRYIHVATLGAYVWDLALNLSSDYALLFKHPLRLPTVVYFLSRLSTLSYVLSSFIFQGSYTRYPHPEHVTFANVHNCGDLELILGVFCVLAQSSKALLFFLRVAAVWYPNKVIFAIFLLLWLAVTGSAITVPLGIGGRHIGNTKHCINTRVATYTESTAIIALVNDSAVFFAVNYRILADTAMAKGHKSVATTFFGRGQISKLSRALIQGGQHFYLLALCCNIVLLVFVKAPDRYPIYRGMLSIPAVAIINAMGCIVFRKIRFGLIATDGRNVESRLPTITTIGGTGSVNMPRFRIAHRDTLGSTFPLEVRVQQEVESMRDENGLAADNGKSSDAIFP
ncbi:hypothetical protein FB45DRAFT_1016265 [Roridomyces roridus]|uniref:Uncharacterized protein n=1 Tax=Roridomyces roridus TaxID=1738132 RepID=A0AAD7AWK3_9AGAR|nr:hypothetical protein FB45DRAFT_1016265 [Roridomyces roridus]